MDYQELLKKAKKEMPESVNEKSRFEIINIKGHLQGTKTVLTNLQQITNHLHRPIEHIFKYLLKELATPGEIKNNGSSILGRKISSSDVNAKIKKYVNEFVFCKDCGKPDTEFVKEGNSTFIKSMVCGAKHPIKSKI